MPCACVLILVVQAHILAAIIINHSTSVNKCNYSTPGVYCHGPIYELHCVLYYLESFYFILYSCPLTACLGTSTGTIVGTFLGGIVVGCLSTLLGVGIAGGIVTVKKKRRTADLNNDKGKV